MSLHDDWVAAKKQSVKDFKEAQKNYLKAQDKKINATNDAKAKKKALDMVLGEAGLDQGESLDDYLKFADGFGKSLDALEKAIDNNKKLSDKYDFNGGIDKLLANKDTAKQMLMVGQKGLRTGLITFYMRDHKLAPQAVYDQYVQDGAKDQIDLATLNQALLDDWEEAVKNPQTLTANGKKLIERLRDQAKFDLEQDMVRKMVADQAAMKNLGFVLKPTVDALKKEVRDTAKKYDEQINSAAKRWKDLKPQFWQPLDDTLQAIMTYVDAH